MVLTYINSLNKNYRGEQTYEFIFSNDRNIDYGEDWDISPASSGSPTPPPLKDINSVGVLTTTDIELELAINSDHFALYDSVENIIALGWEKESPDTEERLVFHFGEEMESVRSKLYNRDKIIAIIKEKNYENKDK